MLETKITTIIMTEISKCPKFNGEFVYFDGSLYVCPDCGHEFNEEDIAAA